MAESYSIVLGDRQGGVSVWYGSAEGRHMSYAHLHKGAVRAVAIRPDGFWVSAGMDHAIMKGGVTVSRATVVANLGASPTGVIPHPTIRNAILVSGEVGHLNSISDSGTVEPYRLPLAPAAPTNLMSVRPNWNDLFVCFGNRGCYWQAGANPKYGVHHGGKDLTEVSASTFSSNGNLLAVLTSDPRLKLRPSAQPAPNGLFPQNLIIWILKEVYFESKPSSWATYAQPEELWREPVPGATALAFATGHIWVGTSNGELFRWPLRAEKSRESLRSPGAGIAVFAVSKDQRYVLVGCDDGRASVYVAETGQYLMDLIGVQDGLWAIVHESGYFQATESAADSFRVTVPGLGSQKLAIFAREPHFINKPYVIRRGDGSIQVTATVFSPRGLGQVVLDDRWPISSVSRNANEPWTYNIQFAIHDRAIDKHSLQIDIDGRDKRLHIPIAAPVDPRKARDKLRVLLVALEGYDHILPALGAENDAKRMGQALQSPKNWNMPWIVPETALRGKQLRERVKLFFETAKEGEILLFYYAGHGLKHNDKSYLLPLDYKGGMASSLDNALSINDLWEFVRDAVRSRKVDRVVVILDACRTASLPLLDTRGGAGSLDGIAFISSSDDQPAGTQQHSLTDIFGSNDCVPPQPAWKNRSEAICSIVLNPGLGPPLEAIIKPCIEGNEDCKGGPSYLFAVTGSTKK